MYWLNIAIYVDYDNLFKRLKDLGFHPIHDLNFFTELKNKFSMVNHDVVKYVAFADFAGKGLSLKDQTDIRTFGLDVYHCNVSNKNTTDAELMLTVAKDLFEKPLIDVFVLVSNDRDYVPLMRMIKEKSKKVYVLTTEKAINNVINVFADYHQHIEDLFNLKKESNIVELPKREIKPDEITEEDQRLAGLVSKRFYESSMYKQLKEGKPIKLDGYAENLSKVKSLSMTKSKIINYFRIANELKFVELKEANNVIYIHEGQLVQEVLGKSVAVEKER